MTRPGHAITRPGHAMTRPGHAITRPGHADSILYSILDSLFGSRFSILFSIRFSIRFSILDSLFYSRFSIPDSLFYLIFQNSDLFSKQGAMGPGHGTRAPGARIWRRVRRIAFPAPWISVESRVWLHYLANPSPDLKTSDP